MLQNNYLLLARVGSRLLQSLTPAERATAVNNLADLLITKQDQILEANAKDLEDGTKSGLDKPLMSRLSLTPAKLKNLSIGLKQIADSSEKVTVFLNLLLNEIIYKFHSVAECWASFTTNKISKWFTPNPSHRSDWRFTRNL